MKPKASYTRVASKNVEDENPKTTIMQSVRALSGMMGGGSRSCSKQRSPNPTKGPPLFAGERNEDKLTE